MIYRNIFLTQDEIRALRWFRREVDNHLQLWSQQTRDVREILGTNYKPRYEGLLYFIPFEEFRNIDMKPLGQGKYGTVLAATWCRPRSIEHKVAMEVPVVLKRILPGLEMSEREKLKKFFSEVPNYCK